MHLVSLCRVSQLLQCHAGCHFAECHYAECHYAECHYAECHYAEFPYPECHYSECHYPECHLAECRYAECRGTHETSYEELSLKTFCKYVPGRSKVGGAVLTRNMQPPSLNFDRFLKEKIIICC